MVLAKYLNQHLLEPLKEQQRAEGRSAERKRIRRHLRQQGYNPDAMLPPPEGGEEDD